MNLSWFNTSEAHKQFQAYIRYEQHDATQDMKERELRDGGSIANNTIYFKVRATVLRPRLHTEGFSLMHPHRTLTQGTSTEDLGNTNLEYTTPLSNNNNLYTKGKAQQLSPHTRGIRH